MWMLKQAIASSDSLFFLGKSTYRAREYREKNRRKKIFSIEVVPNKAFHIRISRLEKSDFPAG
jgi:hypothetical protein